MIPHLIWEIQHDFVTAYYHLVERGTGYYFKWQGVYDFILGQLGILNPLVAFIILYFGIIYKPKNVFDKTLKFNAFGVLLFGFIMSFRGHVEANWTSTALVPLMIIAFKGIRSKKKVKRAIYILGAISAVLIISLRGIMMVNYLPEKYKHHFRVEFHDWDTWAADIHSIAGDKPVVFVNSYQQASKYFYYADENVFTYNSLKYRKNQYDLEGIEERLLDKEVILFHNDKGLRLNKDVSFSIPDIDSTETATGEKIYYTTIKKYRTYNFLIIDIELENNEFEAGSLVDIPIKVSNPTGKPLIIVKDSLGTYIAAAFYQKGEVISYQEIEEISNLTIDESYHTNITAKVPDLAGKYYLRVVIRTGWRPPGLNSRVYKINVK